MRGRRDWRRSVAILAAYREGMDCGLLYGMPEKGVKAGPSPYTYSGDDYLVAAFWRGVRDASRNVQPYSAHWSDLAQPIYDHERQR